MQINVRADIRPIERSLTELQRRQMPFATAVALTATAREAADEVVRAMPSVFDRPTPFTLRGVGVTPARKDRLEAVVFVKDRQAKYLELEETGGSREGRKGAPVLLPVNVKLNAFGNIAKGALGRARAKRREPAFVGKVRGVNGFWQRLQDGHVRLLAAFRPIAHYKPKLGFATRVASSVRTTFPKNMQAGLVKALATARK